MAVRNQAEGACCQQHHTPPPPPAPPAPEPTRATSIRSFPGTTRTEGVHGRCTAEPVRNSRSTPFTARGSRAALTSRGHQPRDRPGHFCRRKGEAERVPERLFGTACRNRDPGTSAGDQPSGRVYPHVPGVPATRTCRRRSACSTRASAGSATGNSTSSYATACCGTTRQQPAGRVHPHVSGDSATGTRSRSSRPRAIRTRTTASVHTRSLLWHRQSYRRSSLRRSSLRRSFYARSFKASSPADANRASTPRLVPVPSMRPRQAPPATRPNQPGRVHPVSSSRPSPGCRSPRSHQPISRASLPARPRRLSRPKPVKPAPPLNPPDEATRHVYDSAASSGDATTASAAS